MWVSRQSSEGCGLVVDWSFFESCHGKCYCDPEGGTLKNAARAHELRGGELKDFIKDSAMLYEWARDKSGLGTPKRKLAEKKGKGIYRRFFYFIPSKGTGAVDRSRLYRGCLHCTRMAHPSCTSSSTSVCQASYQPGAVRVTNATTAGLASATTATIRSTPACPGCSTSAV